MRLVGLSFFLLICFIHLVLNVFNLIVWKLKDCCCCNQAFDQQQQDLVDASSKALSYRQEIIEENIRLTYALQVLSFCVCGNTALVVCLLAYALIPHFLFLW